MNTNLTILEYLNDLSSNSPTPGGGNVAAFCAVLSSCLGEMVCNLTVGKKKYSDVEQEILLIKEKLLVYKDKCLTIAAEDNKAFDKVMDAFRLLKDTSEDKIKRAEKIDEATFHAAEVPANLIQICEEILPIIETLTIKGNQNSLSDTGVAILLLSAASQGAYLNVLINCSSLKHIPAANDLLTLAGNSANEIKNTCERIIGNTKEKLSS